MEGSSSDYSDEEVGVLARGQKLWVRGVRSHTTCADIVRALQDTPEGTNKFGIKILFMAFRKYFFIFRDRISSVILLAKTCSSSSTTQDTKISL